MVHDLNKEHELEGSCISLQALFAYLCVLSACVLQSLLLSSIGYGPTHVSCYFERLDCKILREVFWSIGGALGLTWELWRSTWCDLELGGAQGLTLSEVEVIQALVEH